MSSAAWDGKIVECFLHIFDVGDFFVSKGGQFWGRDGERQRAGSNFFISYHVTVI
jgi:hypothetical protein